MSDFEVEYHIDEEAWNALADGDRGLDGEPAFRYLVGDVQVVVRGVPLWPRPYRASLLDLALAFAELEASLAADTATLHETDGPLEVTFNREGESIRIASNLANASALVSRTALVTGVAMFIRAIATAVQARCPGMLTDAELEPLGRWVS